MSIEENEEKIPPPMPLSIKGLKTKPRKSVRRQTPRDMAGYDSGKEVLYGEEGEKVEAKEEGEAVAEVEEYESDEMPPLGNQSKMVIQNISDMLYDRHQVVYKRMDKQDEWHKNMYEKLATTTSCLAHRQDILWESVASLEGSMRNMLAHPSMRETHKGVVDLPVIREMPPWEELPVFPLPYPPPQGNGGQD